MDIFQIHIENRNQKQQAALLKQFCIKLTIQFRDEQYISSLIGCGMSKIRIKKKARICRGNSCLSKSDEESEISFGPNQMQDETDEFNEIDSSNEKTTSKKYFQLSTNRFKNDDVKKHIEHTAKTITKKKYKTMPMLIEKNDQENCDKIYNTKLSPEYPYTSTIILSQQRNSNDQSNLIAYDNFDQEDKCFGASDSYNTYPQPNQSEEENQCLLCCEENILMEDDLTTNTNNFTLDENRLNLNFEENMIHFTMNQTIITEKGTLKYLDLQEQLYSPDTEFMTQKQNEIKLSMRAMLLNWMCGICSDFSLRRETYYYSANFLDRFLSKIENIKKQNFLLIGLTCLYIAAKLEEIYSPKISEFASSPQNEFKPEDIKKMELHILSVLEYNLTPPTLNFWADIFMHQWDIYVESLFKITSHHPLSILSSPDIIQFKKKKDLCYSNYCEFTQIIDTAILDTEIFNYRLRSLAAGLLYLISSKNYKNFKENQIIKNNSLLRISDIETLEFDHIFEDYLKNNFNMELIDILPTCQFWLQFLELKIIVNPLNQSNSNNNQKIELLAQLCIIQNCFFMHKLKRIPLKKCYLAKFTMIHH